MRNKEEWLEKQLKLLKELGYSEEDLKVQEPTIKLNMKLEPQDITHEMLEQYTPEKTELICGELYGGGRELTKMFELLLYNIGIQEAIKYAPREVWLKALELDDRK